MMKKGATFAASHLFLEIMGDVIMGWMLLWRASVAAPKLDKIVANASGEALEALIEGNRQAHFMMVSSKPRRILSMRCCRLPPEKFRPLK